MDKNINKYSTCPSVDSLHMNNEMRVVGFCCDDHHGDDIMKNCIGGKMMDAAT